MLVHLGNQLAAVGRIYHQLCQILAIWWRQEEKKKFMASQDSRKGLAEVVAPVWLSNIQDSKVQDKLRLGWGRNKI